LAMYYQGKEEFNKSLEFNAHKLKGAISVFTISTPFELAQELVDKARVENNSDLTSIYTKLEKTVDELVEELIEIRASYQ
ncbi:hypothetical protein ACFL6I_25970, partial [candidate division KSB1 bacterium]